jgi:hypothetical protein
LLHVLPLLLFIVNSARGFDNEADAELRDRSCLQARTCATVHLLHLLLLSLLLLHFQCQGL